MFKKLYVITVIVALVLVLFAGSSFAAFNGYAIRFNNQTLLDKLNYTRTESELKGNYATFTSTAHDPNFEYVFSNDDVLDASAYKYVAIKYRTETDRTGMMGEIYFHSPTQGYKHPETHLTYSLASGNVWTKVVVNAGEKADWQGEMVKIRFDFIEASNLPAGESMDIEYVAFFKTQAEAEAFDGDFGDAASPGTADSSFLIVLLAATLAGTVILKKRVFA